MNLLNFCIDHPTIIWLNGLPIKAFIKDSEKILEIRINEITYNDLLTCALYMYFYDKIPFVSNFKVSTYKKKKKLFSECFIRCNKMLEIYNISVFSYFGRIQNVLDDCELFSIYMKAISEKILAFIPIKENSVYREKVHKLR